MRRIRCHELALPPDTTRCSPGLRSPSGCSPLDQPVLCSGSKETEQDPHAPGSDHRWCFRVCVDLTQSASDLQYRSPAIWIWISPPLPSPSSDTLTETFPGLSGVLMHPLLRERRRGHASMPFEDYLNRVVAFILYFGLKTIPGEPPRLPARARPSMKHQESEDSAAPKRVAFPRSVQLSTCATTSELEMRSYRAEAR